MASSAQLITTYDPIAPKPEQQSIHDALVAWRSLDAMAQAEALLVLFDDAEATRVLGRAAIRQLAERAAIEGGFGPL